jgi:hypothetical protein
MSLGTRAASGSVTHCKRERWAVPLTSTRVRETAHANGLGKATLLAWTIRS